MRLFRKKGDDAPVDMNERSPQLGVKYKDLMVLDQLAKNGADLSASRHVIYYSYAPSEAVAHAMGREAEAGGWAAEVREPLPNFPDQWGVVCETHAVTTPDFVRDADDFAAYWTPALYRDGEKLDPLHAHAYYRNGTPEDAVPFPVGFGMIAGDPHGMGPNDHVYWSQ